jgi:[ribosomal protein S18]-alanine N-acetyltransferase
LETYQVKGINYVGEKMLLRDYQKEDWDAICDIFIRAKPDELKGSCSPEAVIPLAKDEGLLNLFNNSVLYVAELDNKIVGYGGYQGTLISFLFVDPQYYKRGIATELLKKVITQIGPEAWLIVAKNNIPARELYQKFGFQIAKEFVGKYNGHDVTVLRLALRPKLETWKKRD